MNNPSIPRRNLGKSGLRVSAMGLGCMGMSEFYGTRDDEQSLQVIHRSIELGVDFLDTADMYGIGKTRNWSAGDPRPAGQSRVGDEIRNVRGADGSFKGINGKPEYVRSACEASLRRLGIDVIDLYYQHRVDPQTPIEETVGAMAELVRQGKVRFLGLSEASAETLRRRQRYIRSPRCRRSIRFGAGTWKPKFCRPAGSGDRIRRIQSARPRIPDRAIQDIRRFTARRSSAAIPPLSGREFPEKPGPGAKIEALAAKKGCKPSQLALAWVLSRGQDVVPIPGTKKLKYLEENAGAINVKLSEADLREIERTMPHSAVVGQRYPARRWGR